MSEAVARSLNAQEVRDLLPHGDAFVHVDEVVRLVPGVSCHARRRVPEVASWTAHHFPGQPVLPGVYLLESLAQTAALVGLARRPDALPALVGADRMRWRSSVHPGDLVDLHAQVVSTRRLWRFVVRAQVGEDVVADGELLATVLRL